MSFSNYSTRLLCILAGIMFLLSSCHEETEVVQTVSEEFSGIKKIEIESGFLEVNYQGIEGQETVLLEGILESSRRGKYRINYGTKGNTLEIELDQNGPFGGGRNHGTLYITGPQTIELEVEAGSGKTVVSGIDFPELELSSGSGSIQVHHVNSQRITLSVGSGSIEGYQLLGSLEAETGSGRLRFDQISGNAKIKASSGTIEVKRLDGKLNADLSSGNLNLHRIGEVEVLRVSSGNIEGTAVGLGPKTNLSSSSGRIKLQTDTPLNSYNYDLQAGSGRVTVGDQSSTGSLKINNGALHTIRGSVSSGLIELKN